MRFAACSILVLLGASPLCAVSAQSAKDSVAVVQAVASAMRSQPGGPFIIAGDGAWTDVLAKSLDAPRAQSGELPNCGATVGRIGVAPVSQSGGYVLVIRAPEFSSDRAVVSIALKCVSTTAGRRNVVRHETLVFRRGADGWVLTQRSRS